MTLERPTTTQNSLGEHVTTWATWRECWAAVEQLSGSESARADQLSAIATHLVTIRYVAGLTEKDRVRLRDDTILAITALDDFERRKVAWILTCVEDRQRG